MKHFILIGLFFLKLSFLSQGQSMVRTYYDDDKSVLKEEFFVSEEASNILEGDYTAFYEDGTIKTEGQFLNNKSTGIWMYYYQNGRLRMQGEIGNGRNIGKWEYYYENGSVKMTGELVDGKKEDTWVYYFKNNSIESEGKYLDGKKIAFWKYFHQSGVHRASQEFFEEDSYYVEVYETGSPKLEGKMIDRKKTGTWNYLYEDGTTKASGIYLMNKKNGNWEFYDNTGKIESEGNYKNDLANGIWIHYHHNGTIASEGELVDGQKNGNWKMFYGDGVVKGEVNYNYGDGEYWEYYKNGNLKVRGMIRSSKYNGRWEYYYEDGSLEGKCNFVMGEGEYLGYYNDNKVKMKGRLKNEIKIGIWELYERSGELTGYYKPYYEDGEETFFIAENVKEQKQLSQIRRARAGSYKARKKKNRYFNQKFHEYKAFIIGYNPIAPLVGTFPFSFEYYLEERLGYELVATYIRRPFFRSFSSVSEGSTYSEGYSFTFRQKFYHEEVPIGQPYFAHELKYTSLFHSTNISGQSIFGASEQKYEYALIVGNRFFKNVTTNGFTADGYIGFGAGYRNYNQSFISSDPTTDPFRSLNQNNFSYSIRIGISLGFAIRIKR